MATVLSSCTSNLLHELRKQNSPSYLGLRAAVQLKTFNQFIVWERSQVFTQKRKRSLSGVSRHDGAMLHRFRVVAVTEGSTKSSKSDERIPSWARPDSEEPPPWARDEGSGSTSQQTIEIPFYAYLLASAVTAIAAIGSIFEYVNEKPVFGVLKSDNVFYAPLLGFFVFTGIPTSAFLWFKSVQTANKASEEQDRRDGFL